MNPFRKAFLIYSGKSSSNALLLGGLPFYVGVTVGCMAYLTLVDLSASEINITQERILIRFLFAAPILAFYGYLDDRYEIKAWAKIIFQAGAVLVFSITTSALLTNTNYSNLAFLTQSLLGLALVNGTNLLDGIDGNIAKSSFVSFCLYGLIGLYYGNMNVFAISMIAATAIGAFYLFNKEPAKLYMGESGTTFIGLVFLTLLTLNYHYTMGKTTRFKSLGLSLLPIALPLIEVTISFTRRFLAQKSPFRGDRFHIHHILTNYHKMSHSQASTLIAGTYLVSALIGFSSFFFVDAHPLVGLAITCAIISSIYVKLGFKHWGIKFDSAHPLKTVFTSVTKNEVTIIDLEKVQSFEFKIKQHKIDQMKNDEDDDQNTKIAA
jgi:UDP-GlcNAc:undecaprenyl-phosphate GlcNAc-1-phosphate transferase